MRNWVVRGAPLAAAICMAAAAATAQEATPNDKRPIQLAQAQVQVKTTPLQVKTTPRAPTAASSGESNLVAKVNNWTVGLAGGLPEGTFLRFAAEIARNLNDTDDLRVLAVVTPGATDNVKDLLYLKGMDIAITHADVFEHFRNVEKIPNIEKRVNFISEMYISELHVLVRPEINSFKDLEGKKVSFHTPGRRSIGHRTDPFPAARHQGRAGLYQQCHRLREDEDGRDRRPDPHGRQTERPVHQEQERAAASSSWPSPSTSSRTSTCPPSSRPRTIRATSSPARKWRPSACRRCWPSTTGRARATGSAASPRFIDFYFDRFKNFHEPPYHPKWKSINLAAKVPGWTRLLGCRGEAQADGRGQRRRETSIVDNRCVRQQAARAAPNECRRAGAPVPAVPGVEQVAGQAVT